MNKVFGYARVSTVDQNTDTQIEALEKFGCDKIYQEKISGLSVKRPQLDEMMAILREGDTVVVSRFSRLGRSRDHLINLVGEFSKIGIIFKALDLGIDSSTPAGKMVIGIFAALSEYDREMILEKTKAGQLLAKAKGKHIGRPSGVNDVNFQKVKKGFEKGLSVTEIVNLTGVSISSVKRYRKQLGKGN
ncbi:recombinase family protein [Dyadobacter subterraneus]|uniref:Recombinase family protein n=1 Tax=Dyadobacter subterraneus TaxID=2773304 RepID=A0ABR9W8Y2_9BACT|nr:recombinase family protein [Dyadobacter subterraneus]MBE9461937.1 recombinase family protein [Dyadobacter subterraneus]